MRISKRTREEAIEACTLIGDNRLARVAAPLTVGEALLATHVVEYAVPAEDGSPMLWAQRIPGRFRSWRDGEWSVWRECGSPVGEIAALPARLVPLSLADADPATRGPLEGKP